MMMTEYSSQYAASTMSSETLSGSCGSGGGGGSRGGRVRTVRLTRPPSHAAAPHPPPPTLSCRHGPSLGFSIRGGREHGTGFFVSCVEPASEAHRQGLRVGDQIIRVNGFTVDDAVHKEVLQLISNHTHLTLKVRSVGMIPVKDRKTDSLSWQIITDNNSSLRSSPQLSEKIHDVRISIMVAPRSKLGCGICKGPEWKPGIFIQFTKEAGIAREAGLRPGDQILYCNAVDFGDIPFNEAVNLMKSSRQLDLIVRKGAGSELFPGESSGYNSSASSVTGDQSPSWSDSKRLSIVKEETLDLEDRLSCQLDRLKCSQTWDKLDWEDGDSAEEKHYFKPTIINLSESGTTIKNNGSEECQTAENSTGHVNTSTPVKPGCKPPDVVGGGDGLCGGIQQQLQLLQKQQQYLQQQQQQQQQQPHQQLQPLQSHQQLQHLQSHQQLQQLQSHQQLQLHQHETKTVVVEVHRSDVDDKKNKTENLLAKSSSTSSFASVTSRTSNTSSSLSSAICEEIQRRSEKKQVDVNKPSIDEQIQRKKILKNVATEKLQQHSKLMDEFKRAHRKMFKASDEATEPNQTILTGDKAPQDGDTLVNLQRSRYHIQCTDIKHLSADIFFWRLCHTQSCGDMDGKRSSRPIMFVLQTYEDRFAGKELSQKLSERLSNLSMQQESPEERSAPVNRRNSKTGADKPPPPPPLPLIENYNGTHNGTHKVTPNGIQTGSNNDTQKVPHSSIQNDTHNGTLKSVNGIHNGIHNGTQQRGTYNGTQNGTYSTIQKGTHNGIQNSTQDDTQNSSSHNGVPNGTNGVPNGTNAVHNGVQNGTSDGSLPGTRTNTLKSNKTKPKAPPVPVKTSTLSSYQPQPPPCPTPDYDTLSLSSNSSTLPKQNGHRPSQDYGDTVEMESLESFKLTGPYGPNPKPPNTYFSKTPLSSQLSNGSTTSQGSTTRKQRPVSVTIGEYPSATLRRQPGRLDFLNGRQDERARTLNQPITSQFASELQQTLSRSNLKKRTESMVCRPGGTVEEARDGDGSSKSEPVTENANTGSYSKENLLNNIKPQSNGSVRISLNNLARNMAKSTNDLTAENEDYSKVLNNRVTININNTSIEKKQDAPNGILKNGNNGPP